MEVITLEGSRLDYLLWEQNHDNFVMPGYSEITQDQLDEIPFDLVDELSVSRNEDYEIIICCKRHIDPLNMKKSGTKTTEKELIPGTEIIPGTISLCYPNDFSVVFGHCYYEGCISRIHETEYKLICSYVEGKSCSKKAAVVKEWIINGSKSGLYFLGENVREYQEETSVWGKYGDMEFPVKRQRAGAECPGRYIHVRYLDTAFDIEYLGDSHGPKWSTSLCITYFEKYGRIPSREERDLIRDYLSFFIGRKLIYTGETLYDECGKDIGFVMEQPYTYGFGAKMFCNNGSLTPINSKYEGLKSYFEIVQKFIDPFAQIYTKLDLRSLFYAYWYAKQIVRPLDLPIMAGALEHLETKWYEVVDENPDKVLMDKKDFSKRIKPLTEIINECFEGSGFADRMQRSVESMNRMTINEQMYFFFEKLGLRLGKKEKKALQARSLAVHGSFREKKDQDIYGLSRVYECLTNRVVLALIGYKGKYIDIGTIGYPEKDINDPCGDNIMEEESETKPE